MIQNELITFSAPWEEFWEIHSILGEWTLILHDLAGLWVIILQQAIT